MRRVRGFCHCRRVYGVYGTKDPCPSSIGPSAIATARSRRRPANSLMTMSQRCSVTSPRREPAGLARRAGSGRLPVMRASASENLQRCTTDQRQDRGISPHQDHGEARRPWHRGSGPICGPSRSDPGVAAGEGFGSGLAREVDGPSAIGRGGETLSSATTPDRHACRNPSRQLARWRRHAWRRSVIGSPLRGLRA
jgi:hypothetical protein